MLSKLKLLLSLGGAAATTAVSPFLTYLKIAVVLSPFVVWGVQELRMKWAVDAAVTKTETTQRELCDGRLKAVEAASAKNGFETVTVVYVARDAVAPTPVDKSALKKLCLSDDMCRSNPKAKR